jgi:hypothetical protein
MVLELKASNKKITELIESDKPFIVTRVGWHETNIAVEYLLTKRIHRKYMNGRGIMNNSGIYSKKNDVNAFKLYSVLHM